MKIKETKKEKNNLIYTISTDITDLQKAFNEAINQLGKGVTVKGFRPGKAPKYLVVGSIGEKKLQEEIFSTALESTYSELMHLEKFDPIDYPKIDVKKYTIDFSDCEKIKGELEYTASVEIMPEAVLKDYEIIKITKKDPIKVEDKEVDGVMEYLARQKAQFKSVATPAQKGNRVEINFEGELDGIKLPEMASKNHPLILGDNTMIPGFEDELIGMKVGDEKEFSITFPKDYGKKEIAGKKAKFKVDMLLVQEIILPVFDDKMAADFGHKTYTDLKDAIQHNIEEEKIHDRIHAEEEEIVEQLQKLIKVEVPKTLIEREMDRMVDDAKARVDRYKIPFTQYLAQLKKTKDEFREEMRESAEKAVKTGFALREVIKKMGIKDDSAKAQHSGEKVMEELLKIAYKNSGMGEYKPHTH